MEKDKKNLKIYSILFLFLALVDLIMLALNFVVGDIQEIWNAQVEGASTELVHGIVIALMSIIFIIVLVKLFLGIRGLQQSNGKVTGKAHIVISKIGLFFIAISIISSLVDFDLFVFLDSIVSFAVLYEYRKLSKKLLVEKL